MKNQRVSNDLKNLKHFTKKSGHLIVSEFENAFFNLFFILWNKVEPEVKNWVFYHVYTSFPISMNGYPPLNEYQANEVLKVWVNLACVYTYKIGCICGFCVVKGYGIEYGKVGFRYPLNASILFWVDIINRNSTINCMYNYCMYTSNHEQQITFLLNFTFWKLLEIIWNDYNI